MADDGEEKNGDFYSILGLEEECSEKELKTAFKKLVRKWHPDKLSDSARVELVEEANEKFQDIQEAYSEVLYDVGVYESNDQDDKRGMGAFLEEITQMIHDNKHKDYGQETLEDLQRMFVELFQEEVDACISSADIASDGDADQVHDSSSGRSKICHEASESANGRRNAEVDGGGGCSNKAASSSGKSTPNHL